MTIPHESADCHNLQAEIVALIDNELEFDAAAIVRARLSICAACARFHDETTRLLQVTRDAFPIPAAPDLSQGIANATSTRETPANSDLLLAELRSVRAEMQAMRSEIDALHRRLAEVRGGQPAPPPRPVSRLAFPYASPPDVRRRDA